MCIIRLFQALIYESEDVLVTKGMYFLPLTLPHYVPSPIYITWGIQVLFFPKHKIDAKIWIYIYKDFGNFQYFNGWKYMVHNGKT
jgi:hypothetical protein